MTNLYATDDLTKEQRAEVDGDAPHGALKPSTMDLIDEAAAKLRKMNCDPSHHYNMGPTGHGDPLKTRRGWGMRFNYAAEASIPEKIEYCMQQSAQYQKLAAEARESGHHTIAKGYSDHMIAWLDRITELEKQLDAMQAPLAAE